MPFGVWGTIWGMAGMPGIPDLGVGASWRPRFGPFWNPFRDPGILRIGDVMLRDVLVSLMLLNT